MVDDKMKFYKQTTDGGLSLWRTNRFVWNEEGTKRKEDDGVFHNRSVVSLSQFLDLLFLMDSFNWFVGDVGQVSPDLYIVLGLCYIMLSQGSPGDFIILSLHFA